MGDEPPGEDTMIRKILVILMSGGNRGDLNTPINSLNNEQNIYKNLREK